MSIDIDSVYNSYSQYPMFSHNCISYLIENDDEIWKLLKYTSPDAWSKNTLTKDEKASLVYSGQPDETQFRVFMDVGADDSWKINACILRVSPLTIIPSNHIYGRVTMGFEVYSHYKINHLSNYTTRIDSIIQRLLYIFNGTEIGGLGRLYFDIRGGSACRMSTIGAIPMKGKALVMCNWTV